MYKEHLRADTKTKTNVFLEFWFVLDHNALCGLFLHLLNFCLYIIVSAFVGLFVCVRMCASGSLFVSCAFTQAYFYACFVLFYLFFILSDLIIIINSPFSSLFFDYLFVFNKRGKECGFRWCKRWRVCGRSLWRELSPEYY